MHQPSSTSQATSWPAGRRAVDIGPAAHRIRWYLLAGICLIVVQVFRVVYNLAAVDMFINVGILALIMILDHVNTQHLKAELLSAHIIHATENDMIRSKIDAMAQSLKTVNARVLDIEAEVKELAAGKTELERTVESLKKKHEADMIAHATDIDKERSQLQEVKVKVKALETQLEDEISERHILEQMVTTLDLERQQGQRPTVNITNPRDDHIAMTQPTALQTTFRHQYNVLLLGRTGGGKSTFINGFQNYLKFSTLAEAEADAVAKAGKRGSEDFFPMNVTFSYTDPGSLEKRTISIGKSDENEHHQGFGSVTQKPKSYIFSQGDVAINLIDTPGIDDTRGRNHDVLNIRSILDILSCYTELHAICVVVKSKEERLTECFRYCIVELFRHLHESASGNVVFCFTNVKDTDYVPGQTLHMLKELLQGDAKLRSIKTDRDAVFCFENEPVKYLAEVLSGWSHDEGKRQSISKGWQATTNESRRLFNRIKSLKPHNVRDTISLQKVKRTIESLAEPLIEITKNGVRTMNKLETLQLGGEKIEVAGFELRMKPLDPPVIVCTNECCVEVVGGKTSYKQICGTARQQDLWFAPFMRGLRVLTKTWEKCNACGCVDRHFAHKIMRSLPEVIETSSGLTVEEVRERKDGFQKESKIIVDCLAKLSVFQRVNALWDVQSGEVVSDVESDVLKLFIGKEIDMLNFGDEDSRAIAHGLQKLSNKFESKSKELFDKGSVFTAQEIEDLVKKLYTLPLSGKQLRKAVETIEKVRDNAIVRWGAMTKILKIQFLKDFLRLS